MATIASTRSAPRTFFSFQSASAQVAWSCLESRLSLQRFRARPSTPPTPSSGDLSLYQSPIFSYKLFPFGGRLDTPIALTQREDGGMEDIREIFEKITERHSMPLRIGSRCESEIYYRVEDIRWDDLEKCAEYLTDRIDKVCSPNRPSILIDLHGGYTGIAAHLADKLSEWGESVQVLRYDDLQKRERDGEDAAALLKGQDILLVNEVITTARSCLEAHSKITMMGGSVMAWVALIDRTFGPGPVPVVASFTGAPVRLVDRFS